jgi:hypothetical protein
MRAANQCNIFLLPAALSRRSCNSTPKRCRFLLADHQDQLLPQSLLLNAVVQAKVWATEQRLVKMRAAFCAQAYLLSPLC